MTTTGPAIGIDLGTTYSCVGVMKPDGVKIIANDQGNRITPSYVAFTDTGRLIGDAAKNQAAKNPHNTVFDVTRLLGVNFDEPSVQGDIRYWPYTVKGDESNRPIIEVQSHGSPKTFYPEEIVAMVLGKLKEIAEAHIGQKVTDAVITVPAYFNQCQRQATKDAAQIAGLNVLRLINATSATAIAYLDSNGTKDEERMVLIFDLGGATLDVSLLTINDNNIHVKATAGDTHVGGEDFVNRLLDYCVQEFERWHIVNLSTNARAPSRLRTACERAKRTLSSAFQASIDIDGLFNGEDYSTTITRARFEDLCMDYFRNCLKPVEQVLKDAGVSKTQVDEIVLVGGCTRIPKVQQLIQEFFDGKIPCRSINPDEASAHGAAVQAAILTGCDNVKVKDILLHEVTPCSYGVQIASGEIETLIERNSPIPTSKAFFFPLENEQSMPQIYEGQITGQNNLLGKLHVEGTSSSTQDALIFKVTLDVDANGLFSVATLQKNEDESDHQIMFKTEKSPLSQKDLKRMVTEAKKYTAADEAHRMAVEARNGLESNICQMKNALQEGDVKAIFSSEDRASLLSMYEDVQSWLDSNSMADKATYDAKQKEVDGTYSEIMKKYLIGSAIGIDLGTTYSRVAIMKPEGVVVIADDQDNRAIPSYVAFTNTGRLVGGAAKNQAAENPHNTVFDAKRLIGRRFNETLIGEDIPHWPFTVKSDDSNRPLIEVEEKEAEDEKGEKHCFYPEEITAMILTKMKEIAEAHIGQRIANAVITVPACFNDAQRRATKDAGQIAGLNVLGIINDSTAAAITYCLNKKSSEKDEHIVLIFDLGGGSLDVAVFSIDKDGMIRIKATAGDTHLGGKDFDKRLVDYCVEEIEKRQTVDLSTQALNRLQDLCENAKRQLSFLTPIDIDEPSVGAITITRDTFEELCIDYFHKCLALIKRALRDAAVSESKVHEIVLVGGSTRIPRLQQMIQDYFGGKEPCQFINRDQAVVYGAAIKAAILSCNDNAKNIHLADVISHTIGLETFDGKVTKLIKRNTSIPTKETHLITTKSDNQPSTLIQILEGDKPMAAHNNILGRFHITDIPPAPRGSPKIAITFEVDVNGILNVSAVSKLGDTFTPANVTEKKFGLSKEETDRLQKKAETYKIEWAQRLEVCRDCESRIRQLRSTHLEAIDQTLSWIDTTPTARTETYHAKMEELINSLSQSLITMNPSTPTMPTKSVSLETDLSKVTTRED